MQTVTITYQPYEHWKVKTPDVAVWPMTYPYRNALDFAYARMRETANASTFWRHFDTEIFPNAL